MPSHPKVHHAARAQLDDEEDKDLEEEINHRKEVAGPHVVCIILQERVPILRRRRGWPYATQVGADGVLGDADTQFEQFAADPFRTPARILGGHLLNQVHHVLAEMRPPKAGTTLEPPEELEPLAMPTEESIRFENQEGLLPRWKPAGEEQQGEAVPAGQVRSLYVAVEDDQLLTEQRILEQELGLDRVISRLKPRVTED